MKNSITFLMFFLFSFPAFSQGIAEKTACTSLIGRTVTINGVQNELLVNAKKLAVSEFFGELIVSFTKMNNYVITEDRVKASSAGFIRMKGNPRFFNGTNFGEVCVSIQAYAEKEDFEKFKPKKIAGTKRSCITEGDLESLQKRAREKAIKDALIPYNRKLKDVPSDQVLSLLHETKIEEGFLEDTTIYCAKASGLVYPIEIETMFGKREEITTSLKQGLTAYYPFNGNSNDESENNNHGKEFGGISYEEGVIRKSARFNGNNSYMEMPPLVQKEESFTVAFWMKYESQLHREWVIYFGHSSSGCRNNGYHFILNMNKEFESKFGVVLSASFCADKGSNGMGPINVFNIDSFQGKWVHITVTYDMKNKNLRSYINSDLKTNNAFKGALSLEKSNFYIGKERWGGSLESKYKGLLDDVRVYNRVLNEEEIQALYTWRP